MTIPSVAVAEAESLGGLSPGIDPTTFSVLLHAIGQASDEMTKVLQRGARSTIISIARDHSASIYTADRRMLYQNDALPVHTVGGTLNLEAIKDEFGDDIHDGDVFMVNDPYSGTTHNSDLTVIMPVFFEGRHIFLDLNSRPPEQHGRSFLRPRFPPASGRTASRFRR